MFVDVKCRNCLQPSRLAPDTETIEFNLDIMHWPVWQLAVVFLIGLWLSIVWLYATDTMKKNNKR
jgi:hypothetical protein